MQYKVIFVGSQFRNNNIFLEYINRELLNHLPSINETTFFDDNDNSLFLYLQNIIMKEAKVVLVCSKMNFSIVGKLLCTITEDTQIIKDDMLLPSKSDLYEEGSYLLNYNQTQINALLCSACQKIPTLLFNAKQHTVILHIFNENNENIRLLLTPLAKSFDLSFKVNEFIYGWHIIEVFSLKYGELKGFINAVTSLLTQKIIKTTNILSFIIDKLLQNKKKITTAESCTGGLLASLLTKESKGSTIFDGGIVTYSNEKKVEWLGVEKSILKEYGAVSKETVLAMSRGAKDVAQADFALSISGIAGPTGGSYKKPIGTIYLSLCSHNTHTALALHLQGDRNYIQVQAAYHALKMLILSEKEIFFQTSNHST